MTKKPTSRPASAKNKKTGTAKPKVDKAKVDDKKPTNEAQGTIGAGDADNSKANPKGDQRKLPKSAENLAQMGHVAWLMMHSKAHKHLFVTDLEWACEPAIALGQCYFWHRGHIPVGYASWAYLSEDAEKRMLQGVRKLSPSDWQSGDRLWLMDLIVPFGGMEDAAKELREKVLKGKKVKSFQPAPDGSGMAVVEW